MHSPIRLDFEKFKDPGLYLLFDDGLFLPLTRDFIDNMKRRYLRDPRLVPPSVRNAPEYAPCTICPKRDTALICHAIPTVFPFLEEVDRFLSHDSVLAVFRPEPFETSGGDTILHVARTSVQRALQYISILSLMYYCEVGRDYFKYFAGVIPFMDPLMLIERVYLNMYWDLHGKLPAINALIAKMRADLDITIKCQMDRLHLFCKSDAFLNAFVNTHIATQFLEADMEKLLREQFSARNAPEVKPDFL
jgi:hypothetical protein